MSEFPFHVCLGAKVGEDSQNASVENATGADPVALALALGGASRTEADAFLRNQNALVELQKHHLREELRQLALTLWEKRMGVALRAATMAVGVAVAAGIAAMIWSASRSNELIVDSFSVPPDLVQKGVSGQVLAGQLVDRLTEMQERTVSFRAPQTYANNFGDGIKLEIPETGVSFAELNRFLRESLGDNKHISGDLIHAGAGLKLSVRVSGGGSDSMEGTEDELDALVQRTAEAIYSRTQPFRYGTYVWIQGRNAEANILFQALAKSGSASERSWAYTSAGSTSVDAQGNGASDEALAMNARFGKRATEMNSRNAVAWYSLGQTHETLGRSEEALFDFQQGQAAMSSREAGLIRPDAVPALRTAFQSRIAGLWGAFGAAAEGQADFGESGQTGMIAGISTNEAIFRVLQHDPGAARAALAHPVASVVARAALETRYSIRLRILLALSREDWRGVLTAAAGAGLRDVKQMGNFASEEAWIALAEAELGRFADAEIRIRDTPADCNPCLIARAKIAALQGQHARADWWFARAAVAAPSIPFAHYDWGRAMLVRGDADGAIAKFKLANRKGPHFADPLEGWGEALVAKRQAEDAIAKFAEAERYAPQWGRLHLKWGEALMYTGRKDEAKKQFSIAARLDLAPGEKSELALYP